MSQKYLSTKIAALLEVGDWIQLAGEIVALDKEGISFGGIAVWLEERSDTKNNYFQPDLVLEPQEIVVLLKEGKTWA